MQNINKLQSSNKVLVIGGGLGGIRTALDLAEAEKDVILVDKAPAIGGLMTQLDRTFPTNNCDLCTLAPHLSETSRQQHIVITSYSIHYTKLYDFNPLLSPHPEKRIVLHGDS